MERMSEDLKIRTEEDLLQSIEKMYALLEKLRLNSEEVNSDAVTDVFMQTLLHVYLLVARNPCLRQEVKLPEFLNESAPMLAGGISQDIVNFQINIENLFSQDPDYDPWEQVCYHRSAFEALRELYQNTQDEGLQRRLKSDEDFNPEDVDFIINERAFMGIFPEDEIPVGIPRSHWWWWGEKAEESLPA
jgi:hypothetical protein